jgi:uncharacterized membrane protein YjjP (DUF1212 family)
LTGIKYTRWFLVTSIIAIAGTLAGVFGAVRSGALLLSVGTAVYVFDQYRRSKAKRRVELYLPLLISLVLFVVALTLPHAK